MKDKKLQFNILLITMDVDYSNQLLDNVSGTLYDHIKKNGGNVNYHDLRFIIKQGILLLHVYQTIQQLLEKNIVHGCIQNLHQIDHHVHDNEDFLRELEDELDSIESDSIYVQYAIAIKKYKKISIDQEEELRAVLNTISLCTLDDMMDVIELASQKIKAYKELKENVCASIFRVFEYIVEYEQLQSIMREPSLPSFGPLPVVEEETDQQLE
jgi:hypothetical protein